MTNLVDEIKSSVGELSEETLQAQIQWMNIVEKFNEMNASLRMLYPALFTFRVEGMLCSFIDKHLRNFIDSTPKLKEGLRSQL